MLGEESDATDTKQRDDGDDNVDAEKPSSDVLAPGSSEFSVGEQAKGSGAAGVVGHPEIVVEAVGPEQ
jgi:hypothetical protein